MTNPEQGKYLNRRVQVTFDYDPAAATTGVVVRDDMQEPHVTIIKLDSGRFVLGTECQYRIDDRQ